MPSRKPVLRRKLRFMLDGYLIANNIERPQAHISSKSLRASEKRKARSPRATLHRHNSSLSQSSIRRILSPPPTRSRTASPTHGSIIPDNDDDQIFPDTGCDPVRRDTLGDNSQAAASGTSGGTQLSDAGSRSLVPVASDLTEDFRPDPLEVDGEDEAGDAAVALIHLPKLQTTQKFIDSLRVASLDDAGMDPEDLETLRNPGPTPDLVNPSPLLHSLRHFINNAGASRDHYDNLREIELEHNPKDDLLSFDRAKRRIRHLSGVVPLEHDMCPESCIAYTGPYGELDKCPECQTTRYHPETEKPRKQFSTVPIGPVIQAFYGSPEIAKQMHYLEQKLSENLETATLNGGTLPVYNDTTCGSNILTAWKTGTLRKSDIALQLSIDGAQLRRDQPSEAWVFIWIIHNLPPHMRYKKVFVIPGAIVPGPNKPGDMDSFLFPSLHHVAALQREGLKIYDSSLNTMISRSAPVIIFSTADSPGSASMSGMVGHTGKYGCRLHCEMPSRHRDKDSHYYPAMSRPDNYSVAGCCHLDITRTDLHKYRSNLPGKYKDNIQFLLEARTQRDFEARRLAVGLCKQTLFSGLPNQPLPVLNIFTMDLMHLSVLNNPDLFIKLFTGKLDCYEPDDRSTWDWAVFYQNQALWNAHGETITMAVPYLPSSFGRAPRDPAKKINSGYKAWEYQQYVYGLGPTMFRHILPRQYWVNFCKLVAGIRILQRHHINRPDLLKGHAILEDFVEEFETLYYRRMES